MRLAAKQAAALAEPLPPDAVETLYVDNMTTDVTKREMAHVFRPFEGFKVCIHTEMPPQMLIASCWNNDCKVLHWHAGMWNIIVESLLLESMPANELEALLPTLQWVPLEEILALDHWHHLEVQEISCTLRCRNLGNLEHM